MPPNLEKAGLPSARKTVAAVKPGPPVIRRSSRINNHATRTAASKSAAGTTEALGQRA